MYWMTTGIVIALLMVWALTPPANATHGSKRVVSAAKKVVWPVVSDVANYHKYANGLTAVEILSGNGEGMIRTCSDEFDTWSETCTKWVEGEAYAFSVNTEDGFPFPFKHFSGTWTVTELLPEETEIAIEFDYQFDYRWMNWFLSGATRAAIEDGNDQLLDNWEQKIKVDAQLLSARQ